MMKLYNYGGTISKNLLITNTANIKLVDFANSFNRSLLNDTEKSILNQIELTAHTEGVAETLTASNPKLLFCMNKMMVKYPTAKTYYGVDEFTIVYEFLVTFYDKSLPNIDGVIRFLNLYIGKNFASESEISALELKEMSASYSEISEALKSYTEIIPAFVYEEFGTELKLNSKQIDSMSSHDVDIAFDELIGALN
jgi:hypothetical protein